MSKAVPFSTTLDVRDNCLCLHAQRTARVLARRFDQALRPIGITNQQYSLLMALNRPEPPTIGMVAALLGMDRTTLTAALKPLERRGLAETSVDSDDRRGRRLSLTTAGEDLLGRAVVMWRDLHSMIEGERPGIDFDRLRAELRAIS